MKANSRTFITLPRIAAIAALASSVWITGCVPQAPVPSPAATPAPTPRPAPPQPVEPAENWRDRPITQGDWNWAKTADGSAAQFAGDQFVMRCNTAKREITLFRAAQGASGQVTMSISTTQGSRSIVASPVQGGVAVSLPARDPLLDAMAFSRGRFAIETTGYAPLFIPSWTEVSRVIEDCR